MRLMSTCSKLKILHNVERKAKRISKVRLGQEVKMEDTRCWKWLQKFPGYAVHGSQIKIISSPGIFYSSLKYKAANAKRRICLASLYLGNGSLEKQLVSIMDNSLEQNSDLKVKVLLDHSRGSRGANSSREMLLPLVKKHSICQVFLFHSPRLRGFIKKWLPERWNEIIALQHMKIYIFDDTLIMSGANLSNDYFTNRQDRFVMIEDCSELTDFMENLMDSVAEFSFRLDSNNDTHLHPNWKIHPIYGNEEEFNVKAKNRIEMLYKESMKGNSNRLHSFLSSKAQQSSSLDEESKLEKDTWIFPLVQMGTFGIDYDSASTLRIFKESDKDSKILLATGYFNLTSEYINEIVKNSTCDYSILMAHPKANGFWQANGFAGGVPDLYTLMAKRFYNNVTVEQQQHRIGMFEFIKNSWTFHGKGMWFYLPSQKLPSATLIGSPNFGHRSVYRDLETQLYVVTTNAELRQNLQDEQQSLFADSFPFSKKVYSQQDRIVPLWVKLVAAFFRNFF